MKSKSLKIASILFLILSMQIVYAHVKDLNVSQCNTEDNERSKEQEDLCAKYMDSITHKPGMPAPTAQQLQGAEDVFKRKSAALNKAEASKAASAAGKLAPSDYCKKESKPTPAGSNVLPYGSSGMTECERLSRGNMKTFYKGGSKKAIPWEDLINYSCKDKCNAGDGSKDTENHPFTKCVADGYAQAKKCESIAFVINSYGRDWDNEEHTEAVSSSGSSGPVGAKTTQNANGNAASVSIGGGSPIKCQSKGVETVDYEPCKKFQTNLELMDGIQQVGYTAQEMVYKDKMIDSQVKYANEKNTATGALKAQGESLKDQESMYQQRTAVDTVKLGYLFTIYNDFPKSSDVAKKCQGIAAGVSAGGETDPKIKETSVTDCENAVRTGMGGFALTMNQPQLDSMRSKLVNIATSAGANLLLANLLGKRADDVNNAVAKIDAFKPVDPFTTTEAEAQTTFCRMNPGAPSCLTGDLERTFDTMNDNVITFGDVATGTSFGSSTNSDGTSSTNAIADTTKREAVGPVGSVIAGAVQDNSMEGSTAAKVNTTGTGSNGGGGGGGSAGGGLGGGGGGGAPAGGAAAGQAAAIASRAPNYSGGSNFSVMGGFGINKKKADGKTEENPFGKLFGKDGGAKQGDLNFRDIASQKVGGKGDNLFDMISKRYGSVNADKRLLEYELKK